MNEGEHRNIEYQSRLMDPGSFLGMLFPAIYKADTGNRARLKAGFPEEVRSVERWTREESYAEKLRAAFRRGGAIDGKEIE